MSYTKTIVCLANSRKMGESCVAGKEVCSTGYGPWIRPVNAQNSGAILPEEQKLADGNYPEILDVISIPMLAPQPADHQCENHLIDPSQPWEKVDTLDKQNLSRLLDDTPDQLWTNLKGFPNNDRIPTDHARTQKGSLLLIQPDSLNITVDWGYWKGKKVVIANFCHNQWEYALKVTDPIAEKKYKAKSTADYKQSKAVLPRNYLAPVDDVYLCISLAQNWHGYCYKLVATIIGDPN